MTFRMIAAGASLLALAAPAAADEGMWLPSQMAEVAAKMKEAGAQVPPEQLADLTKAPNCPLALSLNTLVSGFTYIAKDKGTADLVVRALSA